MPYIDIVEFEDVVAGETELGFPNHGRQVCVKELVSNCQCLHCKPHTKKHWKSSYCKYGFKPALWQEEEPKGCAFLTQPDNYYCGTYCKHYDAETKAKVFEEIFGYSSKGLKTKIPTVNLDVEY